jgi:hypothetical protein
VKAESPSRAGLQDNQKADDRVRQAMHSAGMELASLFSLNQ